MSILSKKRLGTTAGIATSAIGVASNLLGQLAGVGSSGQGTGQSAAYTEFTNTGVMRDNLFATNISLPAAVGASNKIQLYAENVNLPGVNIITGENRRYGYGPNIRYARDVSFNDVTVGFIGDAEGSIQNIFNKWVNTIVKFDKPATSTAPTGPTPFLFNYKDDYVASNFTITVFNEKRDNVLVYLLEDAFPIAVSDLNLNWGSTNQLARFNVTFAYTRWTMRSAEQALAARRQTSTTGDSNLLGMVFRAGAAVSLASSLSRPRSIGDVINVVNNARVIFG